MLPATESGVSCGGDERSQLLAFKLEGHTKGGSHLAGAVGNCCLVFHDWRHSSLENSNSQMQFFGRYPGPRQLRTPTSFS